MGKSDTNLVKTSGMRARNPFKSRYFNLVFFSIQLNITILGIKLSSFCSMVVAAIKQS